MAAEVFSLPASTSLLAEVNKVGPVRFKGQDGTVGDRTHMGRVSDHNLDEIGNTGASSDADDIPEVHARDIDSRGPWLPGWSMERIVQTVLARCRSGIEKRLKYIIYRGRIWSASSGWVQKVYAGADQHIEHAHFSFGYGSGAGQSNPENITSPWGIVAALEEDDMPTAQEIAKAVWDYEFTRPNGPDSHGNTKTSAGAYQAYSDLQPKTAVAPVLAAITALAGKDMVNEDQIVAGILAGLTSERLGLAITAAGLTPEAIGEAIPEGMAEQVADVLGRRISSTG